MTNSVLFSRCSNKGHRGVLMSERAASVMQGLWRKVRWAWLYPDNINNFSPACDGILEGSQLAALLHSVCQISQGGQARVVWSFIISLVYNIIGLSFALTGTLSPVVAAILMPASSISIVLFTTVASRIAARRLLC
ncbi:MAG: hypothetical protein R2822_25600 [Spirosomataceae bacterium]